MVMVGLPRAGADPRREHVMKSMVLRLTQNGRTVGVRADAIVAVTPQTEGRSGSLLLIGLRGDTARIAVAEEPDAILVAMDEALGFAERPIPVPCRLEPR